MFGFLKDGQAASAKLVQCVDGTLLLYPARRRRSNKTVNRLRLLTIETIEPFNAEIRNRFRSRRPGV